MLYLIFFFKPFAYRSLLWQSPYCHLFMTKCSLRVARNYIFQIFSKFWNKCFRISKKSWKMAYCAYWCFIYNYWVIHLELHYFYTLNTFSIFNDLDTIRYNVCTVICPSPTITIFLNICFLISRKYWRNVTLIVIYLSVSNHWSHNIMFNFVKELSIWLMFSCSHIFNEAIILLFSVRCRIENWKFTVDN